MKRTIFISLIITINLAFLLKVIGSSIDNNISSSSTPIAAEQEVINQVSNTLPTSPVTQVFGGRAVTEEEHLGAPSLALVDINGKQICGLTAITEYAAIGVGHCFFLPDSFYSVIANSATITPNNLSSNAQVVGISRVESHPNHTINLFGAPQSHDIAIVFFDQPLKNIQPSLLASSQYLTKLLESTSMLQLEGVGYIQPSENAVRTLPDTFQHIFLPLISSARCAYLYPNVFPDNFCAGFENAGKGTCQMDSGSGLYEKIDLSSNDEHNANRVLVGAVSYASGCAIAPTVFTNFSYHRTFIEEHVPDAVWYDGPIQR